MNGKSRIVVKIKEKSSKMVRKTGSLETKMQKKDHSDNKMKRDLLSLCLEMSS